MPLSMRGYPSRDRYASPRSATSQRTFSRLPAAAEAAEDDKLRVVVIGSPGDGKSNMINNLTGITGEAMVGDGTSAVTKLVTGYSSVSDSGIEYVYYDSPGVEQIMDDDDDEVDRVPLPVLFCRVEAKLRKIGHIHCLIFTRTATSAPAAAFQTARSSASG